MLLKHSSTVVQKKTANDKTHHSDSNNSVSSEAAIADRSSLFTSIQFNRQPKMDNLVHKSNPNLKKSGEHVAQEAGLMSVQLKKDGGLCKKSHNNAEVLQLYGYANHFKEKHVIEHCLYENEEEIKNKCKRRFDSPTDVAVTLNSVVSEKNINIINDYLEKDKKGLPIDAIVGDVPHKQGHKNGEVVEVSDKKDGIIVIQNSSYQHMESGNVTTQTLERAANYKTQEQERKIESGRTTKEVEEKFDRLTIKLGNVKFDDLVEQKKSADDVAEAETKKRKERKTKKKKKKKEKAREKKEREKEWKERMNKK